MLSSISVSEFRKPVHHNYRIEYCCWGTNHLHKGSWQLTEVSTSEVSWSSSWISWLLICVCLTDVSRSVCTVAIYFCPSYLINWTVTIENVTLASATYGAGTVYTFNHLRLPRVFDGVSVHIAHLFLSVFVYVNQCS